jgi:hypothetical protein
MHACVYIHARLATPMHGSPVRARRTHAATCCVRAHARVCVWDWAPTHPRRTVRARFVGVDRGRLGAQAFYRASAFNANIGAWNTASVLDMYRVCAAFSARRRATAAGRARRVVDAARAVVRGGTAEARARVCAQTCGHAHARAPTCVGIAARTKDGIHACIYVYVYMCVYYTYVYRYMCTCVRDGYGRACGCTASHARVRAIARADDAAVAIMRERGYVRRHIWPTHTSCMNIYIYIYIYRCKVRLSK